MNEAKILYQFGLLVKECRQKNNLSQEQLATLADLDRTYISGIERGKRNLSLVKIIRIASALDIPPSKLMSFPMEQ